MTYLIAGQRRPRLIVENASGISEVESFRFQPVLHPGDIGIGLREKGTAGRESGEN